jgi:hypothetical protein
MHDPTRSLVWQGQAFRFQRLPGSSTSGEAAVWAVSRRGEFIGTMRCNEGVTAEEFDVRGRDWLRELFGRQGLRPPVRP